MSFSFHLALKTLNQQIKVSFNDPVLMYSYLLGVSVSFDTNAFAILPIKNNLYFMFKAVQET